MKNHGWLKIAASFMLIGTLVLPGCEYPTAPSSFFANPVGTPDNTPSAPSLPLILASDGIMTVSWTAVEGADRYEVYYSDTQTAPGTPAKTPVSTVAVINSLTNKTTYYVWVKAVNTFGVSTLSPMAQGIPWPASEAPAAPGAPTVIPGINQLTLSWAAAGGAESYDVYINTTPNSGSAGLSATVTGTTTAVIGSLTNETIYYFWIKARNTNGASGFSPMEVGTPTAPTTAPATPGAPVVTPGNKELTVSWAAVEMAMAYEVWVGTSNNSASASKHGGDISDGELSTIITGLNNGTAYYVWVKAKNTIGASGFSPVAAGTPSAFTAVPEEPGMPSITPGSAQLTVQWTAVEGAAAYEVWTGGTDNSASAAKYGSDITGTSITITGLSNGITRYVWIKAKNSVGTSGFSPIASGTPSASAAVPAAPSAAPTVTAGSQQLTVSWAAVGGAAAYEVWAGTSNSSAAATKHGADITSGLSAVIGSLTNGTTYYVWVKAKNSIGTSGFSPAASATPSAATVIPQVPGKPSLVIGNARLTASWAAVEGAAAYEVWMGTSNNTASAAQYGGDITGGLSVTISGLVNGTPYYVWVKAKNSVGASGFSAGESGKPIADAGTPTGSSGNGQIAVSWASIAGADQYEVYCGTGNVPPVAATQTVIAPAVSTTIGSLTNGTSYHIWVKGKNTTGTGGISPMASAKPIANMGTVSVTPASGKLALSWAAVAGADQYEVYQSTSTTPPASATQTVSAASATITGLSDGTMYYVWVKGKNASGTGGISAMVNGKPLATPGTPTVVAGNGELSVSWTAAAGADEYEVYYGIGTPSTLAATVSVTSATITGLTNGTAYAVRIRAKNATGLSGTSAAASGKPLATPGPLTIIAGYKQLAVSWTAAAGADQYEVYYGIGTATTLAATVSGTSTTITGLTVGTTYSVRIRGKNATGVSGYSTAVSGIPIPLGAGLYDGVLDETHRIGSQNLAGSVTYLASNAVTGHNYYIVLGADESAHSINLSYPGKTIGITLMGSVVERKINLSSNARLFTLNTGVTLTLGDKVALIGRNTSVSNPLISTSGGTLVMKSGARISDNNGGGGVSVNGGSFTMEGGTISGNTISDNNGGGVRINGGSFIMKGGTISNNTARDGGGVYISDTYSNSYFTMEGGTISGNSASGQYGGGGGVYVIGGNFTLKDGTISGNSSNYQGGGVFVSSISDGFTMEDGIISGNSSRYGGGVYADGLFTMKNGTISGNTAGTNTSSGHGGGVYIYHSYCTMEGGTISGNFADGSNSRGGGVYIDSYGFIKTGPSIIYGDTDTTHTPGSNENTAASGNGHAVSVDGSTGRRRDNTAGTGVPLDSSVVGTAGGWE